MDILVVPVYVLQGSSCYLVALIVFLRLLAVKHPVTYSTTHKRLSNIISVTIWIALSLIASVSLMSNVFFNELKAIEEHTYLTIQGIAFTICFSLPILSTIIMYGVLLYNLRQKTGTTSAKLHKTKKATARLTKGVVTCLLVCNLPWVIWIQYTAIKYPRGFAANVFDTTFGV